MTTTTTLLREILNEGQARTQSEIQAALASRGEQCSQSKVSRLLNQIGAVKIVDGEGKTQYRLPHEVGLIHELSCPQEKTVLRQWVLSITANESLIVVHTTPGAAAMIARIIDQQRMSLNIIGTIAGDDTVFIAPNSIKHLKQTMQLITDLLHL